MHFTKRNMPSQLLVLRRSNRHLINEEIGNTRQTRRGDGEGVRARESKRQEPSEASWKGSRVGSKHVRQRVITKQLTKKECIKRSSTMLLFYGASATTCGRDRRVHFQSRIQA